MLAFYIIHFQEFTFDWLRNYCLDSFSIFIESLVCDDADKGVGGGGVGGSLVVVTKIVLVTVTIMTVSL
jgi:hypothetical protein